MAVPVLITSFRPVWRSNTSRAPTRRRLRSVMHWIISRMIRSRSSVSLCQLLRVPRPRDSSAFRSSGWNRMISTRAPLFSRAISIQFREVRPSMVDTPVASSKKTRPLSTALPRVCLVSRMIS